tara:strand:- start:165 stop:437 length:273 start_codon:yes stop_codon:yes gene_type:complete
MKVKMFDKEWEVKNPTYREKRELQKKRISALDSTGKVNTERFYDCLEFVEKISGLSESDFFAKDKPLTMGEIDALLTKLLSEYLDVSKKD